MTQGAAKKKMAPRTKMATLWKKSIGPALKLFAGKNTRPKPHTGGPPPFRPKSGTRRRKTHDHDLAARCVRVLPDNPAQMK
jgi:hypothetical protein